MRVIAIVNQKGGSGKTTTSVNLAACLAEAGKRVLLIDIDSQASTSLWLGQKDQEGLLYKLLTEDLPLISAIRQTSIPQLEIIPSSILLSGVEKALAGEVGAETILKDKLQAAGNRWDYVLIDCPPALGTLSLNALSAASEVLVPVEAHVMALHGLVQLNKTISLVKKRLNPNLEISGILACRVDMRTGHSKEVVQQLHERFQGKVFKTVIRENIKLAEAPLHLKPISQYEPSSRGSLDYKALAEELIFQETAASNLAEIAPVSRDCC